MCFYHVGSLMCVRLSISAILLTSFFSSRRLVSVSINFTLFGVGVVFLLLSSINIANLLQPYWSGVSFCYIGVAVAVLLLPVTMLGRPLDFW